MKNPRTAEESRTSDEPSFNWPWKEDETSRKAFQEPVPIILDNRQIVFYIVQDNTISDYNPTAYKNNGFKAGKIA
jgi:hypothetical protein